MKGLRPDLKIVAVSCDVLEISPVYEGIKTYLI